MIQTANRFLGAALGAATVTAALFWVMTALIRVETPRIITHPPERVVLEVFVEPPEPEIETITHVPKRPLVTPPAPLPSFKPGNGNQNVHIFHEGQSPVQIDPGSDILLGGPPDGDAVPLVRVPPRYPPRALARGVEGRVLVEFTISRIGTVEDAHVVAFDPSPVFNQAALEAIRSWRYEPKRVGGQPVAQPGQQIVIPFKKEPRRN